MIPNTLSSDWGSQLKVSAFPPGSLRIARRPETSGQQEQGHESHFTTKARGCRLRRAVCRQRQAASREQLPGLKNGLRLRLQEHLALLENAKEAAQDGRALGLPWNFLWPLGQRPGDQTGMSWEPLWLVPNGTSGHWLMFRLGRRCECPRGCKLLSCHRSRNWVFLSSPARC